MTTLHSARRTGALLVLLVLAARAAPAQQQPSPVRTTAAGVVVDFQDADLRFVITALAEAAGINVTYGDLPAKRVTLHMPQPVPKDALPGLLKSIAESNGLDVMEQDGLIHISEAAPGPAGGPAAGAPRGPPKAEVRLYVYRLKHARAARIAQTLQAIFTGGQLPGPAAGLAAQGLSEQLRRVGRYSPIDTARNINVTLETPNAQTAAPAGSLPAQLSGEMLIVPDESTNSLMVRATAADWVVIRQAIEAMDLRPLQVLIEVVIAEVSSNTGLDVSVAASAFKAGPDSIPSRTAILKGVTNDVLLRAVTSGAWSVDVALSMLATRGNVKILSRPVVLAQNNQEAHILVGTERPFIQVSRSLPGDVAVRDQVVQYRNVGTQLSILPTINPDGYVTMQLLQQISSATPEIQFDAPVIATREASTHLLVMDGHTVVIGGLVQSETDKTKSGIPGLMDIPGIGMLFGTTSNTTHSSELFLFLTPHILKTDEDIEKATDAVQTHAPLVAPLLPQMQTLVPNVPDPNKPKPAPAPASPPANGAPPTPP
jgi:general secretion pathway protein D